MYNRKLLQLLLIVILIITASVLAGRSGQPANHNIKAERGIIDLTALTFKNNIAKLDGEWEFYGDQLLDPAGAETGLITGYIAVPSTWNKYATDRGTFSQIGYATYRLTFITDKKERLALRMPRVHTAYKLWVNRELSAAAGTVGKTRATMTPQYLPQVAVFETQPGNNEIVIQVSNFYHRSGGILESIKVGGEKTIHGLQYKNIARNILLFGCLVFIGAYHLFLFFFRKKNTSALYFGLFCILIGIRTLLIGECFLIYLYPGFNWEIAHKIMTLTYYLGVPLILMYFRSVFPAYFKDRMIKIAQIIAVIFGALVILTPALIFTIVNPLYQIWTIIAIIYIYSLLIKITIHKEMDSSFIIVGASALLLTVINDIIFLSIWMNDSGPAFLKVWFRTGNLSSLGQLIFAFANSILLAKKFSYALEQEEIVAAQLTEVNSNLDAIVLHRTEALIESNAKIEQQKLELERINRQLQELSCKDPLTNLWNRRKYDETINSKWNQCLRQQKPLALIFLDIDYFKEYNDYYGHLAGDECLIKIGGGIKDLLAGSTAMTARYGGEEFIVVLPETEKNEALGIADRLRQKIEALRIPHALSPVGSYITVSLGVTCAVPNENTTPEMLFITVDKALYQAKAGGKNLVSFRSLDE